MRTIFHFFIILILVFCSCCSKKNKTQDHKGSLIGKWYRFSMSNGYSEFDIDSQFVTFYNQKVGRIKLQYKIEGDSFKYLSHNYAAKFMVYNDSIFLMGNDYTTATLYKFKEPIPFINIPEVKDSLLFNFYLNGFDQRMLKEYQKAGIKFLDKLGETADTAQMFQQLLKMKEQ